MKSEIDVQPQNAKHIDEGVVQNNGSEIAGRSVFAVGTSAAGIFVQTLFIAEDGRMLEIPAVFPNLGYALDQIDHLKRLVIERFEQAAQVGVQVIAANNQQNSGAVAENSASAQPTN